MTRRLTPAVLTELSVAIALAAVLSLLKIKLPHLVWGGSVSLHTVPIAIVALRHGVGPGLWAGAAYGVVNFLLTPYIVHPIQLILDYPAAFAVMGLTGLAQGRSAIVTVLAVIGASAVRLALHVLSGIVYFADLAPEGTPVLQYSLLYNSSYMIPETVIVAITCAAVGHRLTRR